MGPRGRPATYDEVVLAHDQVDVDPKIWEGGAEVVGDPFLTGRPWLRLGRAEVVSHVLIGEDLERELGVALIPDFVVEAPDEGLVVLGWHPTPSFVVNHS